VLLINVTASAKKRTNLFIRSLLKEMMFRNLNS